MIRQKSQVQHVGVADEHVGGPGLEGLAGRRGSVAVINGRGQERGGEGGVQFPQGLELVLFQGLKGKKVKGPGLGFGHHGGQHRQVVNQGLAAGRGRGRQQVLALAHRGQGLALVAVQAVDAQAGQGLHQGLGQIQVPCEILHRLGREILAVSQDVPVIRGFFE